MAAYNPAKSVFSKLCSHTTQNFLETTITREIRNCCQWNSNLLNHALKSIRDKEGMKTLVQELKDRKTFEVTLFNIYSSEK